MSATYVALSRYRAMWLFVCFDLPVLTKTQRREAARFRKNLLKDGFSMMQYSVYIRPCATNETMAVHLERIKGLIPPEGLVSVLRITDRQFAETHTICGNRRVEPPKAPVQLELF